MKKLDRGTLRAAGLAALLTVVFLVVNTAVAAAATGGGSQEVGGLLAPLNVTTSEGAPLEGYQLGSDGGSVVDFAGQSRALMLSGLFTLVRLLVGLACWLIEFAFRFPLWSALMHPAQQAADAYNTGVVGALGLKGLLLGWAFVFGLILFVRGKVGQGLGEIVLTLLVAAFAASAFIRPDYLLAKGGPLDQTHQAAVEVAQITTTSYFGSKEAGAGRGSGCDKILGSARNSCSDFAEGTQAHEVAKPIQDALTNALVVKPFQLLEYGRTLDANNPDDAAAYKVHLRWVSGGYNPQASGPSACDRLSGIAKDYCHAPPGSTAASGTDKDPCANVVGLVKDACEKNRQPVRNPCDNVPEAAKSLCEGPSSQPNKGLVDQFTGPDDPQFAAFTKDLAAAGPVGQGAAAYAKNPTWDRVGACLLLLAAVIVIALMVCAMGLVLLATQGADAAATACGGLAFVWAMLPGPNRSALWRWLSVFLISAMVMFVAALFIPLFGIATDALLTDGPNLMVERLLLLDALAIGGLAFHRRLLAGARSFGQRMAMRMRYARVGGTHLPGDTSEIGAALAMNAATGGMGGGSGPAATALGLRAGAMADLAALADPGVPFGPGRLLGDALAEGRRGWAPVGLALRGAYGALIGRRPDDETLARLRKPLGPSPDDGDATGAASEDGLKVNKKTGEILHDPQRDRPLLGTRLHNRAVRYRGARVAMRTGRLAYGATFGLPRNLKTGRRQASQFTQDAATQLKVAANQVREDAGQWADGTRAAGQRVDHLSQKAHTAWTVHGAPAVRKAATGAAGAAAGAAIYVSPTHATADTPPAASTQQQDPSDYARQRVFDALMRAQRTAWGGGGDGDQ